MHSPAYPALIRTLTVVVVIDILAFGIWLGADLRAADWTASGAVMFVLAVLSIVWMGWWIVNSKTRLEGNELVQTWLWTRRVHARDVTRLKFVHIPRLERIVAPRLLVHRRGGGMSWFHSADPELLVQFAHRVAAFTGESVRRAD